jgi:hypothetical protein
VLESLGRTSEAITVLRQGAAEVPRDEELGEELRRLQSMPRP